MYVVCLQGRVPSPCSFQHPKCHFWRNVTVLTNQLKMNFAYLVLFTVNKMDVERREVGLKELHLSYVVAGFHQFLSIQGLMQESHLNTVQGSKDVNTLFHGDVGLKELHLPYVVAGFHQFNQYTSTHVLMQVTPQYSPRIQGHQYTDPRGNIHQHTQ